MFLREYVADKNVWRYLLIVSAHRVMKNANFYLYNHNNR